MHGLVEKKQSRFARTKAFRLFIDVAFNSAKLNSGELYIDVDQQRALSALRNGNIYFAF